jgi:diguanylate cyclase (GGDEF)-like protein
MSSLSKQILAIYLAIVGLGFAISTLIYFNEQDVAYSIENLVGSDMALVNNIANLRLAVQAQKPLLYEYYTSNDAQKFQKEFALNKQQIAFYLNAIDFGDQRKVVVDRMHLQQANLDALVQQLGEVLTAPHAERNAAKPILEKVSLIEAKEKFLIDRLALDHQASVSKSGSLVKDNSQQTVNLVNGFSVVITLIAILVGYYVDTFMRENMERKVLSMFPERNPNPAMRLSWQGDITYTNPATQALLTGMGLHQAAELLPSGFARHLDNLKHSLTKDIALEYKIGEHNMECLLCALPDLEVFHVYVSDVTSRKAAESKLIHQAFHDHLTGLPNRRMFSGNLQAAFDNHQSEHHIFVALIQIDRIKKILASQGYEASDNLIRTVAQRLSSAVQQHTVSGDAILFRFEGATFGLLVTRQQGLMMFLALLQELRNSMNLPIQANNQEFFFSLSIGYSQLEPNATDVDSLLKNAEVALTRVTANNGDDVLAFSPDMNAESARLAELENGLRYALARDELVLHFQPQIDIQNERLIGAEALIRWKRADGSYISPAEFIPVAEESGLIIPIGTWVLRTACQQACVWRATGIKNFVVAVNISARQFQHPDFVNTVRSVIRETGVSPEEIELEITESVAMVDMDKAIETLQELQELNLQLSIDDFGTGYSSLSYLKRFPINKLKVDQSFVRHMSDSNNDASITNAIVLLGKSLNLRVIAEGVETKQQLDMLREMGCNEVQGYYFSRPLPVDQFFNNYLSI